MCRSGQQIEGRTCICGEGEEREEEGGLVVVDAFYGSVLRNEFIDEIVSAVCAYIE